MRLISTFYFSVLLCNVYVFSLFIHFLILNLNFFKKTNKQIFYLYKDESRTVPVHLKLLNTPLTREKGKEIPRTLFNAMILNI